MYKYLPLLAVHKHLLGGIVRVCGLAMTPRIILMTDGEPSDDAGEVEVLPRTLFVSVYFICTCMHGPL